MKIPILYFCTLIGGIFGQSIVKPPTDTTGKIGGTAKFECEVQYGGHVPEMSWLFNEDTIYSNKDTHIEYPLGTNKYVVSVSHAIFILEVRDLSYEDGGNYFCNVKGIDVSADLIVLGSPIVTQKPTNLMEGTNATFICETKFGGPSIDTISPDHHPHVELFLDDLSYQAKSDIKKDNHIGKVYEILVDGNMDTKNLKCEIGTTKSKLNLTWSTSLKVLYSVRNLTYSPHEDKYEFGSNITCSARGNPIPQFEWRNIKNASIVIKGHLLHITEDMNGQNFWICTARNCAGGNIHEDEITADFEAVSIILSNKQEDEVDWLAVIFLVAVGCIAAGILSYMAFKRFRTVFNNFEKSSNATPLLYVTTAATVVGSSFQHGWNTGVLNIPQVFIKKFIDESFTEHYGFKPSSDQLELMWAVCVSIYLISGCFGVLVASNLADKLGRKHALLFCHPFGIIAAIMFSICKMVNSLELLIIGRLIVGFSCGAGSRLVLKYLTSIAPDDIQNGVVVVHQFGITFGILLSQIAGLHLCLGTDTLWPFLLTLTALPSMASFLILLFCPQSPIDHLVKHKRKKENDAQKKRQNEMGMKGKKEGVKEGEKEGVEEGEMQVAEEGGKEVVEEGVKEEQMKVVKEEEKEGVKDRGKEAQNEAESDNTRQMMIYQHQPNDNGNDTTTTQETSNGTHYNNAEKAFIRFRGKDDFSKYNTIFKKTIQLNVRELFQRRELFPCLILLCGLNIGQQLSGINVVFYYSQNVFKATGVPQKIIEYCVLSTGVINVLMTGASVVGHYEHRHLLLIGMLVMVVSSFFITLALHLQIFYISLIFVNTFVLGFALELGLITTYIARKLFFEGPRTPAITVAGSFNWLANFFVALVYPVLQLRVGPNAFWIFTSFLLIFIIYFFIRVPHFKKEIKETKKTKDKTTREIHEELRMDIKKIYYLEDETELEEDTLPLNPSKNEKIEMDSFTTYL